MATTEGKDTKNLRKRKEERERGGGRETKIFVSYMDYNQASYIIALQICIFQLIKDRLLGSTIVILVFTAILRVK